MATKQNKKTNESMKDALTGAGIEAGEKRQSVTIKPPLFRYATFNVSAAPGVPLVIHRFSAKEKARIHDVMAEGKTANSKKNREPKDFAQAFQDAKYTAPAGWEGLPASSIRKAMISACRLVNFKMTLAKLSVFVEADGWDKTEPQVPLIRIYGTAIQQEDIARVETGQPYVTVRPAYHDWKAKIKIRFDADQFTVADVTNLLARVGLQVGLCEGRPDSKNSAGMGWGLFVIEKDAEVRAA